MRNGTFLTAAALLLAGCGGQAAPSADHAWVRLPAVSGRPAAAYFTLHGGAADTVLTAVRTMGARRAEMHDSMAMGGMTTMHPLATVPLPAGGTVTFTPGGRHVMLYDVDAAVRPGQRMTLYLILAGNRSLPVEATVVGAADPAP